MSAHIETADKNLLFVADGSDSSLTQTIGCMCFSYSFVHLLNASAYANITIIIANT